MICPNCQNDVVVSEKDFGALFNCPNCHSGYFINFDGQPEYSDLPAEDAFVTTEPNEVIEQSTDLQPLQFDVSEVIDAQPFESFEPVQESTFEPQEMYQSIQPQSDFANIAEEISNFGNTETQIAALNYDLTLSGLDTREDLVALKEMLSDSRFGWDENELMKSIKNGQLVLQKLNPVQAYVLAKRIHFLDIEMKWKQNVLE